MPRWHLKSVSAGLQMSFMVLIEPYGVQRLRPAALYPCPAWHLQQGKRLELLACQETLARPAASLAYKANVWAACRSRPQANGADTAMPDAAPMAIPSSKVSMLKGHGNEVFICAWSPTAPLLASG